MSWHNSQKSVGTMCGERRQSQSVGSRITMNSRSFWHVTCLLSLLACLTGCDGNQETSDAPSSTAAVRAPAELFAVVVDDAPLSAAIESEWNARADGMLKVQQITSAELLDTLKKNGLTADLIIYPVHLLGELVERDLLIPIPADFVEDPRLALADILPTLRLCEATWGTRLYASSLGSPSLVLYYLSELLEAAGLLPPTTWDEYDEMVVELGGYAEEAGVDQSDVPRYAVAEPLASGWAGQVLLARAAAYAKHRNNYSTLFRYKTMEPLIAGPPFVRALEQLVAAAKRAPPNVLELTPRDVRQLFEEGGCAMAISWPSVDAESEEAQNANMETIAFAELPGSRQVYHIQDGQWQDRTDSEDTTVPLLGVAGRLVSVTSTSHRTRAALGAMVWLTGNELGLVISPQSSATGIFRTSQLAQPSAWFGPWVSMATARQHGEVITSLQSRKSWLCSLRIPGRDRYMSVLDEAVHCAVRGKVSPQEALEVAADRWRSITAELGVERQSRAYRRSVGLEF